jgi:AcrR family transcriptional regulator
MARPRAANYEVSRDAILTHAVQAFAVAGYPSASMSELARVCGTSKAGLYHYYPSKEALLFDSLDRYTKKLIKLTELTSLENKPPKISLRLLIAKFLAEYRTSRDFQIALLHDVKFLSAEQQATIKSQERLVVDYFADAIQASFPEVITAINKKPLTMSLLGAMNFTFAWLREDGAISYDQYAHWVAELWLTGLAKGNFQTSSTVPSQSITFLTKEPS